MRFIVMYDLFWLVGRARNSITFLYQEDSNEGEKRVKTIITLIERKPNG